MAAELPLPVDLLPHRGRALVLDELTDLDPGVSATGLWTPDDEYFEGHFPDRPILPGHWTVESVALAAACALLAVKPGITPMFRECQSKFVGQVKPGDTLRVSAVFGAIKEGKKLSFATGTGQAFVGGQRVYEAELIKAVWGTENV